MQRPTKNKILISYAVSSLIPILLLVYLIFAFKSLGPEGAEEGQLLFTPGFLLLFVALLSVVGIVINLRIVKGIQELVRKANEIYSNAGVEQEQGTDEILQLSSNLASIRDKMMQQVEQIARYEQDLEKYREQLDASNSELKKLAIKDDLTDLFNRRYFDSKLPEEVKRAERYKHSLTLMMVTIEDIKAVKDKIGHLVGDMVISEFADLLRDSLREIDIITRYADEQFCVILHEADSQGASTIAARIKKNIMKHVFLKDQDAAEDYSVSVAIGFSSQNEVGKDSLITFLKNLDTYPRFGWTPHQPFSVSLTKAE
jgi:diguanylate cyclase (GGDEF)-like protein